MPDLASVSVILSSVKSAFDIAKALRDAGATFDKAESRLQLASLMDSLADAKMAVAEIRDSLGERDSRIAELERALSFKETLVYQGGAYYVASETGEPTGSPFCSTCWDSKQLAIRLTTTRMQDWKCGVCGGDHLGRHIRSYETPPVP